MKHIKEISEKLRLIAPERKVDAAAGALIGTGLLKMWYGAETGSPVFYTGLAKTAIIGLVYENALENRIARRNEQEPAHLIRDYEGRE